MKLHLVAGARPNFMKIAPLWHALNDTSDIKPIFVHTGQHTHSLMSSAILDDIDLPAPDYHLGGSKAESIATYQAICRSDRPGMVLVVGDVSSALACARVAHEMAIPLVHLEAGLRSFDLGMVEETNRIEIDHLSDLLLTPSEDADQNLIREGISPNRIVRVGNIMIDNLERQRPAFEALNACVALGLEPGCYGVVTLHRPENVDNPERLIAIMDQLEKLAKHQPVCFPVHPRTQSALHRIGWKPSDPQAALKLQEPKSYSEFISLVMTAKFVLTDSGGVQEETSYLGINCFTLRKNTERPVTVTYGSNRLVTLDNMISTIRQSDHQPKELLRRPIPFWDGMTSGRVIKALDIWNTSHQCAIMT